MEPPEASVEARGSACSSDAHGWLSSAPHPAEIRKTILSRVKTTHKGTDELTRPSRSRTTIPPQAETARSAQVGWSDFATVPMTHLLWAQIPALLAFWHSEHLELDPAGLEEVGCSLA